MKKWPRRKPRPKVDHRMHAGESAGSNEMLETAGSSAPVDLSMIDLRSLAAIEREIIEARIAFFSGSRKKAAASLGVTRETVHNRLLRYADVDARKQRSEE